MLVISENFSAVFVLILRDSLARIGVVGRGGWQVFLWQQLLRLCCCSTIARRGDSAQGFAAADQVATEYTYNYGGLMAAMRCARACMKSTECEQKRAGNSLLLSLLTLIMDVQFGPQKGSGPIYGF